MQILIGIYMYEHTYAQTVAPDKSISSSLFGCVCYHLKHRYFYRPFSSTTSTRGDSSTSESFVQVRCSQNAATQIQLPPKSMWTSGTERVFSWSFVPFQTKQTCLDPCRFQGRASRIGPKGIFCTCQGEIMSLSIFGGAYLHQIICHMLLFGRAVRSSQKRKRGATFHLSFLDENSYTRDPLNMFVSRNRSTPIHAAKYIFLLRFNAVGG